MVEQSSEFFVSKLASPDYSEPPPIASVERGKPVEGPFSQARVETDAGAASP
jgi:hypothetical protein